MELRMKRGIKISQVAALVLAATLAGCFDSSKNSSASKSSKKLPPVGDSAAPDKNLYDRAMSDIQHKKFDTARLELNALINTYPETEYLAKAKLAIADSFYKEGGTGNLAQAVAQYKDFITFFPFLPEASYAQMQVAMTYYRQLAKPDRDRSEAELAEQEFQIFLKNYPDSELAPVAAQHLREVQEDLAEGDFRIASYYNTRQSYRAAAGRLQGIADRYPLFSKSDQVLFMLGNLSEHAQSGSLQGKDKEMFLKARTETATHYYSDLVKNYPLSSLVPKAKERLTNLGSPVPQPDPAALARMQQEQQISRSHPGPVSHVSGLIHSGPDVSMAARVGTPNLNPPDDNGGGGETLNAAMTNMNISAGSASSGTSTGGRVEVPGGSAIQAGGGSSGSTGAGGNPNMSTLSGSNPPATAPSNPPATAPSNPPATPASNPPANSTVNPPAASGGAQPAPLASGTTTTGSSTSGTSNSTNPPTDAQTKPCGPDSKDSKQGNTSSNGSSGSKSDDKKKKKSDCPPDSESSSKKKTGIHKIIPW